LESIWNLEKKLQMARRWNLHQGKSSERGGGVDGVFSKEDKREEKEKNWLTKR